MKDDEEELVYGLLERAIPYIEKTIEKRGREALALRNRQLLDQYAGQAMAGILTVEVVTASCPSDEEKLDQKWQQIAAAAWDIAFQMMIERQLRDEGYQEAAQADKESEEDDSKADTEPPPD